eukprot:TRINITY_DN13927_c0_g1_i1.p1 TRINITY_DN13927_c0_g1~~TRINITY_DN13927_c0_g1_i1.p1  ORF type:complete len:385 (+),score=47.26 TRINITY_DN13927_c0_g1_i1:64-1155(+)
MSIDPVCSICLDVMQDPVALPCGHTNCLHCLQALPRNQRKCPECRSNLPSQRDLKVNIMLRDLIRSMPSKASARPEDTDADQIAIAPIYPPIPSLPSAPPLDPSPRTSLGVPAAPRLYDSAHSADSDTTLSWDDFLHYCGVKVSGRRSAYKRLFHGNVMVDWEGLVVQREPGIVRVRMYPSEADRNEDDIKLTIPPDVESHTPHLNIGDLIRFQARWDSLGYWRSHEMTLLGLVTLQPPPYQPSIADFYQKVACGSHDLSLRTFYMHYKDQEFAEWVEVRSADYTRYTVVSEHGTVITLSLSCHMLQAANLSSYLAPRSRIHLLLMAPSRSMQQLQVRRILGGTEPESALWNVAKQVVNWFTT